jgi:hypothetical protein
MSEAGGTARRRRRARRRPSGSPTPDGPETSPVPGPAVHHAARPRGDSDTERGLRDLVGAGPSQLGVSGALRGRDVDRPTDEDLAEAERDLFIVRRNWRPTS